MGNCFGKTSSDAFAQPGRTLGDSAPPPHSARTSHPPKISDEPGRTLGSSGGGSSTALKSSDARQAAARAAEERLARQNQTKGKLGQALAKEKQQTRTNTLGEASRDERRMREADEGAEARNWN